MVDEKFFNPVKNWGEKPKNESDEKPLNLVGN